MTQQPNVRLVLPNPNDATDPANLQAIALWANNFVVNRLVDEKGNGLPSQSQAQGAGAQGSGIVTVQTGDYASLTGPGQSTSPGDLTQSGGFTVNDPSTDGITLDTQGQILVSSAQDMQLQGDEVTIAGTNGVRIQGDGSTPAIGGIELYAQLYGMLWASSSANLYVYIATTGGSLQLPPAGQVAWGFTEDGHIWYYPSGGPWTLKV